MRGILGTFGRLAMMAATILLTVVALVVASVLPASASSAPHWRVYLTSRSDLIDVTATGPHAAWALADSSAGPSLLHWNGSVWRHEPVPGGQQFLADQVQVTPDGSIWVTGSNRNGQPRAEVEFDGVWRPVAVPIGNRGRASRSATSDAWGIAGRRLQLHRVQPAVCETSVWHYTHGGFVVLPECLARGRSPGQAAVSGFWRAGRPSDAATDSGLHRIASPPGHESVCSQQIAASPSGQLWLLVLYGAGVSKPDSLRYWNGRSWARRNVPAKALKLTYGSAGFAWDDHHGVWLGPYTHWTGRRWIATSPSEPTTAFELLTVTGIRGSASAWAVGTGRPRPVRGRALRQQALSGSQLPSRGQRRSAR